MAVWWETDGSVQGGGEEQRRHFRFEHVHGVVENIINTFLLESHSRCFVKTKLLLGRRVSSVGND
jgi:hypothetical protein